MATVSKWTPFGVALDVTATGGTVTRKSATQYTVVINASWETYYSGAQTNYGMTAASGGVTKTLSAFDGTKRSSGSGSFTGTYSISGNGAATKTVTVTFRNFNTDNGDAATKTVSFSVSVPAWTSYKITYNANGGSGAPGSQTKWKDQTLTLSSTKPTRTGYSFLGWSTSSSATTATYSAGGSYTANSAATLYAVWKANTYTVSYNANGGSGAPSAQTKTYGVTLTLSGTIPTRTNYTFKGWGTSASATTASYSAGGKYTSNAAITLYAVWELTYKKPSITNVSVTRNETGETATVAFNWLTYAAVESVVIELESSGGSSTTEITSSGTSGSVNKQLTNLNSELAYTVRITVTDSGGSWTVSRSLPGLIFAMDVKAQAKGVSFGKAAELDGYADFGYKTRHRAAMEFENLQCLYGTAPDGTVKEVINPQNANGNLVFGYDNYDLKSGSTNIYGYDVNIGVSNIANPGTYRPYRRKGDSITLTVKTAGYVTNSGKDVTFIVPLTMPIIGSPTVTATSGSGFVLRQNNTYTHGSSASTFVIPDSYSASVSMYGGVTIVAKFTDTTNVINNNAIGIYWHGTITFS